PVLALEGLTDDQLQALYLELRRRLKIQVVCPSLGSLAATLRTEQMSDRHLQLVQQVVSELGQNSQLLENLVTSVSALRGLMTRIVLYRDDVLEVRAHIFAED